MIKNHSSKPPTHISHLQIQHHSHSETSFYTEIFQKNYIYCFSKYI